MNNVQLHHAQRRNQKRTFPVSVLAHDLHTPANVGSVFRVADAFGLRSVFLTGASPVPPHPKIRKTSRSAEQYVPYTYSSEPLPVVRRLKAEGCLIVSVEITSASIDLRDFRLCPDRSLCMIIGSEDDGVCQSLLDASDCTVHIPMFGENSSMNVATAFAVATFAIVRQYAS